MNIAVDMDDVLVDTVLSLNIYHNWCFGTNYEYDDYKDFRLSKVWGGTRDEVQKKIRHYYRTYFFRELGVCLDAFGAMLVMSQKHKLFVVTSRPKYIEKETRLFLDCNFKSVFQDVIFTDHCNDGENYKRKKSDVCQELRIDVLFDDCPDYIHDAAKVVSMVMVPKKPWNRNENFTENNVILFSRWVDVLESI